MNNWKKIAFDVADELESIERIVKETLSEMETEAKDCDEDEEFAENERIVNAIFGDYLHFECYSDKQKQDFIKAIALILRSGSLLEYYKMGVLFIYLSENREISDKLDELLSEYCDL